MKTSKILINLICLLIGSISVKAQICNTPAPTPPTWMFNAALRSTQTTPSSYTLRVLFTL